MRADSTAAGNFTEVPIQKSGSPYCFPPFAVADHLLVIRSSLQLIVSTVTIMNGIANSATEGRARMIDISNPSAIPSDDPDHPFIPSKTVYEQHRQPIYACAFNPYQPEGSVPILATAAKNMITIYECPLDSNKITLVRSIKDPSPDMDIFTLTWCYDITDKAHRIAFGGYSGLIRLVDAGSGKLLMNMYGHGDHVNEMRTDPNNSMVFASVSKDTTIRLWNIRVHGPIAILGGYEGHKDQILSLDWSMDSKYIVSCSMDHSIRLWYLGTDKLQERIRDSMTLKGQANFRKEIADDCQSGRTIQIHYPIAINTDLHNDYVDCVRFLGHYVVSKGSDMSMVVFRFGSFGEEFYKIRPKLQVDTSALQLVRLDLPDSDIWFIKFDIDPLNRWIVSGNKMGQLCMWDLTDGLPNVNMNVTTKIAECCVRQICFSPDGRIVVAVADDYSVTRLERILEGEEVLWSITICSREREIKRKLSVTTASSDNQRSSNLRVKYSSKGRILSTTIPLSVARFAQMVEEHEDIISFIEKEAVFQ
ncbi:unnamed protein product [Nippostrongylus brasiliensis]|uniref:Polycomb protein mes-6 (inferred by orthology to a C. elegans protein) n=1 Tax=Nippostrongylus brasiliensis TaxID=27835 RepID=A0A0N4Y5G8_NIPBR|nr:unnamed protein product [Nippostrongylus brasiliensis]